jgi:hypothetical protein
MIKLELTIEETNYILNVLASQPYNEVVELITKIQRDGNSQIKSNDNEKCV